MGYSQLNLRQILAGVAAIAILTVVPLTVGGNAEAQVFGNHRAGTASFPAGQDGINITFSSPLPNTNYAVVVQPTNTAGYSPTSDCTYFNPLHKRVDGFEVQHKRCDDGVPVALDINVSLDWIVLRYK